MVGYAGDGSGGIAGNSYIDFHDAQNDGDADFRLTGGAGTLEVLTSANTGVLRGPPVISFLSNDNVVMGASGTIGHPDSRTLEINSGGKARPTLILHIPNKVQYMIGVEDSPNPATGVGDLYIGGSDAAGGLPRGVKGIRIRRDGLVHMNQGSINIANIHSANIANWASQAINPNGFARIGPLLMQWGTVNHNGAGADRIHNFPTPFPGTVFTIVSSMQNQAHGEIQIVAVSNSQFKTNVQTGTPNIQWIAIGT